MLIRTETNNKAKNNVFFLQMSTFMRLMQEADSSRSRFCCYFKLVMINAHFDSKQWPNVFFAWRSFLMWPRWSLSSKRIKHANRFRSKPKKAFLRIPVMVQGSKYRRSSAAFCAHAHFRFSSDFRRSLEQRWQRIFSRIFDPDQKRNHVK